MHTIQLDINAHGLADTLNMFVDALEAEVEAQAPAYGDASMRTQLAKVFATLEMVVEFAHVNEL